MNILPLNCILFIDIKGLLDYGASTSSLCGVINFSDVMKSYSFVCDLIIVMIIEVIFDLNIPDAFNDQFY